MLSLPAAALDRLPGHADVAIIGGGLAGLTLALQLRQASPSLSIVVFEKASFPPRHAAHKVGEATVEIGAHYLAHTLGLEDLLERTQLRKFGLRLFFGQDKQGDLATADELGASSFLPAISYQLDRGRLEQDLVGQLRERRVIVRHGTHVKNVSIDSSGHRLDLGATGESKQIKCRWVVDASARSAVLKRQLGIKKSSDHQMCAAWFRLDRAISVDDLSEDENWKSRCNGLSRNPSTNHLMGIGYWVWIIPLSGGRTSIGLVSDPQTHPLTAYDTFDKFCDWLRRHEPLLASKVDEAAASLMDFHKLRKLSLDSKKLWSVDRWALTGEAGVFADPFYSPGTDFIALGNTFIADLITRNCSDAERSIRTRVYEKLYQSFFDSTMSLYREQYAGFGDARLMSVKTTWDYAYYWSILAWMFFRQVLTDLDFLRNAESRLTRIRNLNDSVQGHFRRRAVEKRVDKGQGRFVDQIGIPILVDLNAALLKPAGPLDAELQENCARLERLAPILLDLLADRFTPTAESKSLLGDLDTRLAGTA